MSKYCRAAAQTALLLSVVALPWIYAGRQMPGRLVAMSVAVLALVLVASQLLVAGYAWKSIRIPLILLACAVGLGAWQLTDTAAVCSPQAAALKSDFAASPDAPAAASALSLHVPATRRHLALLVAAVAAFALGAALFAETKPMLVLLGVVATSGFAVACTGLAERAAGKIGPFFQLPLAPNAAPFGPFLNRNAAGAFMELGLAAAAGLTVWRIARMPRRTIDNHRISRFQWFLMNIDTPLLVSIGVLVTIAAGVVASLSRGAMVSTIVGSLAAFVVAGKRTDRNSYFWLAAGTAAGAAAIGVWLVQSSALEQRWSSILAGDILHESRWRLWGESLEAAMQLQPFGSGLGTFYYAHAPFERHRTLALYINADNQYVETLVVGGIVGFALLMGMCGFVLRAVVRMWRKAQSSEHIGLAAGATALVAMQLVHACFDFAWYLPAVMFPLALWCGAIFRKATIKRAARKAKGASSFEATSDSVPTEDRTAATVWGTSVVVLLAAGLGWSIYETGRSLIVERAEWATRNHDGRKRTTDVLDDAIRRETAAIEVYPDDGEAHLRLAELWVERYGSEFLLEMDSDPVMRLASEKYERWQYPEALNAAANLRARVDHEAGIDDEAGVNALREIRIVKENLQPARVEVRRARELCPLSPFTQLLSAQLCFLDEPASHDVFYLERAERLAGGRDDWLFSIGQLHLNGARPEPAWEAWRKAWSISSLNEDLMMERALSYLSPQEILEKLIPGDPRKIVALADEYFPEPDGGAARRAYYQKAMLLLDAGNMHRTSDEYVRGTALAYAGKLDAAETAFMASVRAVDSKPEWFLDLASVQAALGRRKEADETIARYRNRNRDVAPDKSYLRKAAGLLGDKPDLDAKARRRCAALYLEAGANDEAATVAREAIVAEPSDVDAQVILAQALLNAGDAPGALEVVERTAEAAPQREDVRLLHETVRAAIKRR